MIQEFPKSYYKNKKESRKKSSNSEDKKSIHDEKVSPNLKIGSELDMHKTNPLRNSFILEEDEETEDEQKKEEINENLKRISSGVEQTEKSISLPFSELIFIDLSNNLVNMHFEYIN